MFVLGKHYILLRCIAFLLLTQAGGQMVFFPNFKPTAPTERSYVKNISDDVDCPTEFLLDKILRLNDGTPGDEPEHQWTDLTHISKKILLKVPISNACIHFFTGLLALPSLQNRLTTVTPLFYHVVVHLTALGNYKLLYRMYVF